MSASGAHRPTATHHHRHTDAPTSATPATSARASSHERAPRPTARKPRSSLATQSRSHLRWALSGYPISHDVVGGVGGGSLGYITLDQVAQVGERDAGLAIKVMKLMGIGATSTEAEKSADRQLSVQDEKRTG